MINNFNFHGNVYLNFNCKKCNQNIPDGNCGAYIKSMTIELEGGIVIFNIEGTIGTNVNMVFNVNGYDSVTSDCAVKDTTYTIPIGTFAAIIGNSGTISLNAYSDECSTLLCSEGFEFNTFSIEVPVSGDSVTYIPSESDCDNVTYVELLAGIGGINLNTNTGVVTIDAQTIESNMPIYIYYAKCNDVITELIILFLGNPQEPQQMYSCSGNTCIEDENGQYDHPSCYGNCNGGGGQMYSCVEGSCVPDNNGQYNNNNCNGNCNVLPPTLYSCSGQQCIEDENGQYDNSNCYGNCCLPMNEVISYECIPFVFLGEVNSQDDIIFNQATVTRADGFCGEEIVVLNNYSECCLVTGTYLGYTCSLGTKTKYFNNVECGGNAFTTYTETIVDDVDCLGASALLFTLEYDDINDAPFVYTDITGWQEYIYPTYGRLTDITVSGNFMYFYGYNNTFNSFTYGASEYNIVPVTLKSVTFAPGFDRPYNVRLHTDDGVNTAISTIDLSTFTNLGYIDLRNNKFTSIDLSAYTNLIGIFLDDNDLTSIIIGNNLNLNTLNINNNPIATIDISLNTSLMTFSFSNTLINSLDVTNNVLLSTIQSDNGLLTGLDISNNVGLTTLYLANHPITSIDISVHSLLNNVRFDNADLDLISVDSILSNLVTFNLNNGYLILAGGTNATPNAQGLLDVATLQSRGWTVLTN